VPDKSLGRARLQRLRNNKVGEGFGKGTASAVPPKAQETRGL